MTMKHEVTKTVKITDFLTEEQIKQAHACKSPQDIRDTVIEPNLDEINRKLGQENDSLYLAYAVASIFIRSGAWEERMI